jgi:hypothetical protein
MSIQKNFLQRRLLQALRRTLGFHTLLWGTL